MGTRDSSKKVKNPSIEFIKKAIQIINLNKKNKILILFILSLAFKETALTQERLIDMNNISQTRKDKLQM